jgi:SAM-dependent methyltransferase
MKERRELRDIYSQSKFPIFQNLTYDTPELAKTCPTGEIRLVEDIQTGLVHNAAFTFDKMQYDVNYQNEQALSSRFQQHLSEIAEIVEINLGKKSIVEVGCGKGYFLELLLDKGFDVTGFDPTYEGSNPRVIKNYFDINSNITASGVVLRHVLEHIQNPVDFLLGLRDSNANDGLIYIEVPCFDWICKKRAWFDIFYEHVNYFRIDDFYRMFDVILDAGHVFGGQYIYVVAKLSSLKKPMIDLDNRINFPGNFTASINHHSAPYTAVWGGASKGVIFSLLKSRAGYPVDIVIDINPAKQKRYLPLTGLQVHSPEDAISKLPDNAVIYVMNSNYIEEIREMSSNKFKLIGVDDE